MTHEDCKTVLYRSARWFLGRTRFLLFQGVTRLWRRGKRLWPALAKVFALIAEEFRQKEQRLSADTTEIINA